MAKSAAWQRTLGYWPGSWSSPKPPWKQQAGTNAAMISAYDAQRVTVEQTQSQNVEREDDQNAGMIQSLQKAVNAARKAENRVKKVTAERVERQQQWRTWEADLKKTYAKERQQFSNALAKLEQDLREAVHQQEQARAHVRSVASGTAGEQMEDVATVTDALMGSSPDPWEDTQDAVLQRALATSMQPLPSSIPGMSSTATLPTAPPTTRPYPRTPLLQRPSATTTSAMPSWDMGPLQGVEKQHMAPGQTTRLRPFPPPMGQTAISQHPSPHVPSFGSSMTSDPYMFGSIATGDVDPNPLEGTCVSPPNGPPKVPKNRTPLKEVGKKVGPVHSGTGGMTRESVLKAKREALAKANSVMPPGKVMQFVLHDDDNDTGQQSSTVAAAAEAATEGIMD